jgi:hypothetical protein
MIQTELFEENRQFLLKNTEAFFPSYPDGKNNAPPEMAGIFELSVDAFYAAIHAMMSELPLEKEISRFIEKVKKAGGRITSVNFNEDRAAASRAASDRGDPDVLAVLKAAYKVQHEIHRLTGLLRFRPEAGGVYTARCSPDHFILPALAEHFTLRFGGTPWVIIDEKRNVCLRCEEGGPARLIVSGSPSLAGAQEKTPDDLWEELWRLYHGSVNNESRKNPRLQRQFMPERYHKYLPEMN